MSSVSTTTSEDVALRAEIDRSLRYPLLFFFTSAVAWLIFGCFLALLCAVTLNAPSWFEALPFLSYGKIYPAQMNAFVYGWGMQAGFGVTLWIMARLCRVPLRNPATLVVAGHVWNAVTMLGLLSILAGWGTSVQWLDFPARFWPVILVTYLFIMIWTLGMFASRRDQNGFISQTYILGSVLWFPWIYITANLFIHHFDGAAVAKTAIDAWYIHNMIYMVLAPMALAASYYIVPKVIGRPIFSYGVASVGFWSLVLFAGWSGMNRYMGGPLPAWMPSVGSTASILLIIPALAVVYNQLQTLGDRAGWTSYSPSLRFSIFGTAAFLATTILGALLAIFPAAKYLQFTLAQTSFDLLALYGFFTMTMFGAIYFIVPRIVGCEWRHGDLIRTHFWLSAYGVVTIVGFMFFAGYAQGFIINRHWYTDFLVSVERTRPFLIALTLGWFFITLSNCIFLYQIALMAFGKGRTGEGPTLIHKNPEDYFNDPLVAEKGANA